MNMQLINACLPWAILVVVSVVVARILIWISGAKLNAQRLKSIHNCQEGSVQGISFVLVLPFFVMIMMMIVQASHLMIGNIVVHYSAFAAVRSASVWIPANVSFQESANCIGARNKIGEDDLGEQYEIVPTGDKFSKITQAAVLANFSLGPSRDLGYELSGTQALHTAEILPRIYEGLNPESVSNSRIPTRIRNKLAYSYANTTVDLTLWHRFREYNPYSIPPQWEDDKGRMSEPVRDPPLEAYVEDYDMYQSNEIGWQDHLTATVTYNLPLLPGPIRFFAPTPDGGSVECVDQTESTYIWPITGNATLGNEGEETLIPYWQEEF